VFKVRGYVVTKSDLHHAKLANDLTNIYNRIHICITFSTMQTIQKRCLCYALVGIVPSTTVQVGVKHWHDYLWYSTGSVLFDPLHAHIDLLTRTSHAAVRLCI
jgi:hypothetical protein